MNEAEKLMQNWLESDQQDDPKTEKILSDLYREGGYPGIADYIDQYGSSAMGPWYTGPSETWNQFCAKCVREGHPADFYLKPPQEGTLL